MRHIHEPANVGNRPYQHQITVNLVHSLGMDDAVDLCIQNGWNETLNAILKEERYFDNLGYTTANQEGPKPSIS